MIIGDRELTSGELSEQRRELLDLLLEQENESRFTFEARPEIIPLSYAQQRLWFLHQFNSGTSAYNTRVVFRLVGQLDVPAFRAAWNHVIVRHEILRTSFPALQDQPAQLIHPFVPVSLPVEDFTGGTTLEKEARIAALVSEEAHKPFDLCNGPMLRLRLIKTNENEYVFVFITHHLVSDGWSTRNLLGEISSLYERYHYDPEYNDVQPAVQYADFTLWQRKRVETGALTTELSYWKNYLRDLPPLLTVPEDHPRPAIQSEAGAINHFQIDAEVTRSVRTLARSKRVTVFTVLLAALQTLIHRYTGALDVPIGTAVSNRNHPEWEKVHGTQSNTLVLRGRFAGDLTFCELLSETSESVVRGLDHQELPFELLVDELKPERNLSYSPLFQILMLLHQQSSEQCLQLPGVQASRYHGAMHTSRFDMTYDFVDEGQYLSAALEYSSDLYDPETVERMIGHYRSILCAVSEQPGQLISSIPILTKREKIQLQEWNRTTAAFPQETLPQVFQKQVQERPGDIALVSEGRHWTYEALNRQSNRIANLLRSMGARRESMIGLSTDRNANMIAGLLGILKTGAAYLPLDPAFPSERIDFMMQDSNTAIVLTEERHADRFQNWNGRRIVLDDDSVLSAQSEDNPEQDGTPEDLAYLLYTSGSTGRPKGVLVEHHSVVNLLQSIAKEITFSNADKLLAITTLSFDIAALEIFLPLLNGAKLILASHQEASDGNLLLTLMKQTKPSVMQATPATWQMLIRSGWTADDCTMKILCGGEPLTRALADELLERCAHVWNVYGPTETTIWSTICKIQGGNPISIGRPVSNTAVYILDSHHHQVPVGISGQIFISGTGVTRGYWKREELTAQRFLPDCISGEPSRMYGTGDVGKFARDGSIIALGREDRQVKIRGFRIEPGEVESALLKHPEISGAAVIAAVGSMQERNLVAYVVSSTKSIPELRSHLQEHLPAYMIPSLFVFLDALPLTPNGKVDYRKLPAPEPPERAGKPACADFSDAFEMQIAAIWKDVLQLETIGPDDNFFELGGHSLLAVQIFAGVEKVTGRRPPLSLLFEAQTVRQLSQALKNDGVTLRWKSLVPIRTKGSNPPFFCVHSIGGNVLNYRHLAHHLGNDQPFYAIQSRELDRGKRFLLTMEQMAEQYITEIQSVQPKGPYYLGGQSFGGMVAYEIARQLRERGESIGLLTMIDTPAPNYQQALPLRTRIAWKFKRESRRWKAHTRALLFGKNRLRYLLSKSRLVTWRLRQQKQLLQEATPEGTKIADDLVRMLELNLVAAKQYKARPFEVKVHLLRAEQRIASQPHDPVIGWDRYAKGGIEVIDVPGDHSECLQLPHVAVTASKLRTAIDRVIVSTDAS